MPLVERAEVDAPPVRVRARLIEALDPASAAEKVLGRASAEAVGNDRIFAADQAENPRAG